MKLVSQAGLPAARTNDMKLPSARPLYLLIAIAAFAAVGFAVFTQYHWNMQPCPWCVLQRLLFLVIGALALVAALVDVAPVRKAASGLVALLGAGGIASALWQHFVAARSPSCNMTLADHIVGFFKLDTTFPAVFEVRANCSDAATQLLGLSYEFWSLALFAALAMTALLALRRIR